MPVKPVPAGYGTVTPNMGVRNGAKAIEFYKKAFGATERSRFMMPDGRLAHAEILIGNSVLMMSDESPDQGCNSPQTLGGSAVSFYVYVEDADAVFKKAVSAGAKERIPMQDHFYGDRAGQLEDPFGYRWWIATHKEDVPKEEMEKRMEAMVAQAK